MTRAYVTPRIGRARMTGPSAHAGTMRAIETILASALRAPCKLVAVTLAALEIDDGHGPARITVSVADLARLTSLSRRAVQSALGDLEALRAVERMSSPGRPTGYMLHLHAMHQRAQRAGTRAADAPLGASAMRELAARERAKMDAARRHHAMARAVASRAIERARIGGGESPGDDDGE